MENLIQTLKQEAIEYEGLLELARAKTEYIVKGDIDNIAKITDEEQLYVGRINKLERTRMEVTVDVANVLNKDVEEIKLDHLIQMLGQRPLEQQQLADARDLLRKAVYEMQRVNEQNRELLIHSLELVEFDMNLLHALRTAPQTANYNKGAYNTGEILASGGFDAKQ